MFKLIQTKYEFTDYQIAQLKFFFLTVAAEASKLLIMGFIFRENLLLYIWSIFILQLVRSACGGLHCKTYWGCFFLSLIYMFLAIEILPQIYMVKFLQMLFLLVCIVVTYHVGPITSAKHPTLSDEVCHKLKIKFYSVIFVFYILLFVMPENRYVTTGFWVIILNTLQLITAKILVKGGPS